MYENTEKTLIMNDKCNVLEKAVQTATQQVIKKKSGASKRSWFTNECKQEKEKQQQARKKMLQTGLRL